MKPLFRRCRKALCLKRVCVVFNLDEPRHGNIVKSRFKSHTRVSALYVYFCDDSARKWAWQNPYYWTSNWPSWNRCYRTTPVLAARGKATGRS
jgi:hypothetical protein